jgi:hypothetical protein
MVFSQIIFSLMLLKMGEAAQVCFDDVPGTIDVSIESPISIYNWYLTWEPWPEIFNEKRTSSRVAGASGCSDGGRFYFKRNHGQSFSCPFVFVTELHITCLPGSPFCSLPVTLYKHVDIWWVKGTFKCNCVPGDGIFEDSEANAPYSALIESIIVVENEHSFF